MKKSFYRILSVLAIAAVLTACEKETETVTVTIDSSQPNGTFTASKMGDVVDVGDHGSEGAISIGTDEDGNHFVKFSDDFNTAFATGTVTSYLSTSENYSIDPGNGSPDLQLVGPIKGAGESYIKLDAKPDDKFTHVLIWCGAAGVSFGHAEIK